MFVLGDLEDVLRFLVPAVFVVIWIISQAMGQKQKPGQPPRRPAKPQPVPGGEEKLTDEIEEFLRRVRPPKQQHKELPPDELVIAKPAPERVPETIIQAEVLDAPQEYVGPSGASVGDARGQQQPVDWSTDQPTAHPPTGDGALPGNTLDKRVREAFDQNVGALFDTSDAIHEPAGAGGSSGREESAAIQVPATAMDLRELLSSPANLRTAIVLSEILKRPG